VAQQAEDGHREVEVVVSEDVVRLHNSASFPFQTTCGRRETPETACLDWVSRHWPCVLRPFSDSDLPSQITVIRVLTNLAKWNSLSFPCFPDPLNSLFQTIIKWKPDVTNHLSIQFGSFLAELQNILLNEHGDWLDPRQSLCHPTNLRYCYWQLCTQLDAQEIVSYRYSRV